MPNYFYKGTVIELISKLKDNFESFISELIVQHNATSNSDISDSQIKAWRESLTSFMKVLELINPALIVLLEYKLPMSNERCDLILLGKSMAGTKIALIIEFKGWAQIDSYSTIDDTASYVSFNGKQYQHPYYQLKSYGGKIINFHSAVVENKYELETLGFLYNCKNRIDFGRSAVDNFFYCNEEELVSDYINCRLTKEMTADEANEFSEGYYIQNPKLFESIVDNFDSFINDLNENLAKAGIGATQEQSELLTKIVDAVRSRTKKTFIIRGKPGSGKTYLAILLLFKALRKIFDEKRNLRSQNFVSLGYRNNRFIYSLREVLNKVNNNLGSIIQFYSTGQNNGLAQGNPIKPHFKLCLFDESQRMKLNNIEIGMQRGDVTVFFYDSAQMLHINDEGLKHNFIAIANKLKIRYEYIELEGVYRVQGGNYYHTFIEDLLAKPTGKLSYSSNNYDLRLFSKFGELYNLLMSKVKNESQVALIAAFTESPGDFSNKLAKNLNNLRIGFPLKSGFNVYRDLHKEIYWLMDEHKQYPDFWFNRESNNLTHCASIYGCQGFEADYIGLIWGRDFVLRGSRWQIGTNCEDNVEGPDSLKNIIKKRNFSEENILQLLINRYRIFLTRGIKGTFIFCEDQETSDFLNTVIKKL